MIRKLFFLAAFIGLTQPVAAQFNKALGTTGSWQLTGGQMIRTDDGGYMTIGTNYNYGSGDFEVIRWSSAGAVLWKRHYGLASSTESATCIAELTDHTVVIGGYTSTDGGSSEFSSYFIRIAPSNGYLYWSKTLTHPSGPGSNFPHGICKTSDNCFVVTGTWYNDLSSGDLYAFKMTNAGLGYWKYTYRTSLSAVEMNSFGGDVCEDGEGDIVITGSVQGQGALVMKLDLVYGTVDWAKKYNAVAGSGAGNSIYPVSDGYVVTGVAGGDNHTFKTDVGGTLSWSRTFSGTYQGRDIVQTIDGGYAVADDGGLLKLTSGGGLSWAKAYHGALFSVAQLSTGDYMLSGGTYEFGFTLGAFLMAYTDASGDCCGTLPAIVAVVPHTAATANLTVATLTPITIYTSSPVHSPSTLSEVSMCNCTADAGSDKSNMNRNACCVPTGCSSVTIGTAALSGYTYSWSSVPSSTIACPTCAQPVVSPCVNTTYKVVASASGCLPSYDYMTVLPIYVDCCGPRRMIGPDSTAADAAVEIFPNPAHDALTITLNENVPAGQVVRVEVTDMQGKQMLYQEYASDARSFRLDITGMSAGMYIVNVTTGENCTMQKISVE